MEQFNGKLAKLIVLLKLLRAFTIPYAKTLGIWKELP
jgi:hypothetical protein